MMKEVCRLTDLRSKRNPNLEDELRQLIRSLKPSQGSVPAQQYESSRNIGVGLGYSLLAYKSALVGIGKLQDFDFTNEPKKITETSTRGKVSPSSRHGRFSKTVPNGKPAEFEQQLSKKSKTSESGNEGSNNPSSRDLPGLNEQSLPTQLTRKSKGKKSAESSSNSLVEVLSEFKAAKDVEKEKKIEYRKKREETKQRRDELAVQVLEKQQEMISKEEQDRNLEYFLKIHGDIPEHFLSMVPIVREKDAIMNGIPCGVSVQNTLGNKTMTWRDEAK
ncbi:hypothetical protein L1987_75284 [Smallanthus sonchifolius]|uniref:Uncharacterized protein n=1 Tax=Smallanthus sonchifolius TaxID=185202 RepID=A0ACB9A5H8_9ASTR|nr:hypothetical protein L1987_75284 [Smallanthus sonchifolius]